jgi:predicted kinase
MMHGAGVSNGRPLVSSARLVVFGGEAGVGKTTLSRALADRIRAVWLRVDLVEVAMVRSGVAPGDSVGIGAYASLVALADGNLGMGHAVVIDAVNPTEPPRRMWRDLAHRRAVPLRVVEVVCSDVDEHRRRVEMREADVEGHVMPRWADVLAREYEPWTEQRLTVDTAVDTDAILARIHRFVSDA